MSTEKMQQAESFGLTDVSLVRDSRGYLYDGKSLTQVTKDHSLVQSLVDSGSISQDQASTHPRKNIITQSLGYTKNIKLKIDSVRGRLFHGKSYYSAVTAEMQI